MAISVEHKNVPIGHIHPIVNWTFELESDKDTLDTATPKDYHKVAFVAESQSYYSLINVNIGTGDLVWIPIGYKNLGVPLQPYGIAASSSDSTPTVLTYYAGTLGAPANAYYDTVVQRSPLGAVRTQTLPDHNAQQLPEDAVNRAYVQQYSTGRLASQLLVEASTYTVPSNIDVVTFTGSEISAYTINIGALASIPTPAIRRLLIFKAPVRALNITTTPFNSQPVTVSPYPSDVGAGSVLEFSFSVAQLQWDLIRVSDGTDHWPDTIYRNPLFREDFLNPSIVSGDELGIWEYTPVGGGGVTGMFGYFDNFQMHPGVIIGTKTATVGEGIKLLTRNNVPLGSVGSTDLIFKYQVGTNASRMRFGYMLYNSGDPITAGLLYGVYFEVDGTGTITANIMSGFLDTYTFANLPDPAAWYRLRIRKMTTSLIFEVIRADGFVMERRTIPSIPAGVTLNPMAHGVVLWGTGGAAVPPANQAMAFDYIDLQYSKLLR